MRKIFSLGLTALLFSSCQSLPEPLFPYSPKPAKVKQKEIFSMNPSDYIESRNRISKAETLCYQACKSLFSSDYYESLKLFSKAQYFLTENEKKEAEKINTLLFFSSYSYSKSLVPENVKLKTSSILSNMGQELLDKGRYKEAVDYFNKSIELLPKDSPEIKPLKKLIVFSWFKARDKEKHQKALEDYCSTP